MDVSVMVFNFGGGVGRLYLETFIWLFVPCFIMRFILFYFLCSFSKSSLVWVLWFFFLSSVVWVMVFEVIIMEVKFKVLC